MAILSTAIIDSAFITSKNRTLWDKLNGHYNIIVDDNYRYYELNYVSDYSDVIIGTTSDYKDSLFTHELMHLDLRFNGLNTASFFQSFKMDLYRAFGLTICNCIEHVLFFDDFVDSGYDARDFVMDYNNQEYSLDTLKTLIQNVSEVNDQAILNLALIYAFWTFKNEEYMGVNRTKSLEWLRSKYLNVFISCNVFFDEIIDLELGAQDTQSKFNNIMSKYLRRNY